MSIGGKSADQPYEGRITFERAVIRVPPRPVPTVPSPVCFDLTHHPGDWMLRRSKCQHPDCVTAHIHES